MSTTTIQWCQRTLPDGTQIPGYTFNPWWGCVKISEECAHCYAQDIAHHYGHAVWGPPQTTGRRFFGEQHWQEPLGWNRQAEKQGHRRNVFCASMADAFEDHPAVGEARVRLWTLIEATPMLNWLLLTKRPEHILPMAPWTPSCWPDNVWVGTSVGTRRRVQERLPHLLRVPAVVRFLSCEPLLESLDLSSWLPSLQWVICGGESGPHARPFDLAWARSLREQCEAARIPFFFKQVGGRYHSSGGSLLDGQASTAMPAERVPVRVTEECNDLTEG